jgi:hypothetical protein
MPLPDANRRRMTTRRGFLGEVSGRACDAGGYHQVSRDGSAEIWLLKLPAGRHDRNPIWRDVHQNVTLLGAHPAANGAVRDAVGHVNHTGLWQIIYRSWHCVVSEASQSRNVVLHRRWRSGLTGALIFLRCLADLAIPGRERAARGPMTGVGYE